MYKSKCTCTHRGSLNVRAWSMSHNEDCYYYEVIKQEREQSKALDDAKMLYSHYRREAKQASK